MEKCQKNQNIAKHEIVTNINSPSILEGVPTGRGSNIK